MTSRGQINKTSQDSQIQTSSRLLPQTILHHLRPRAHLTKRRNARAEIEANETSDSAPGYFYRGSLNYSHCGSFAWTMLALTSWGRDLFRGLESSRSQGILRAEIRNGDGNVETVFRYSFFQRALRTH